MSTFSGKIQEIPGISVDRFDGNNLESEAFFLSHCHSDHMVGLQSPFFHNLLVDNNMYLYASKISCIIISKMYPTIKNNLRVLSMYQPTFVSLKSGHVSIISMPAGHCPGSVMFLFETDKCILYTGDFRVDAEDMKKFIFLYDAFGNLKTIHKIYLDTTFFLKKYLKFPKRDESLAELCKIIRKAGDDSMIDLYTSAKYGYEFLFVELYNRLGFPIHVNPDMYDLYSLIPDMDKAITLDKLSTQIHCHCDRFKHVCDACDFNTKRIVVSALRWRYENLEHSISEYEGDEIRVCFSTHNSYEETLGVIEFLKPLEIEVCVEQRNPYDNKEVLNFLKQYSAQFNVKNTFKIRPKLFKVNSSNEGKQERKVKRFSDSFGMLESPPLLTEAKESYSPKNSIQINSNEKSDVTILSTIAVEPIELEATEWREESEFISKLLTLDDDVSESSKVLLATNVQENIKHKSVTIANLGDDSKFVEKSYNKMECVEATVEENENDSETFGRDLLLDIINSEPIEGNIDKNVAFGKREDPDDNQVFLDILNM